MKKQTIYFLATIFSIILFSSCDSNDTPDIPAVPFSPVSITLTSSDNNVTVDESAISGSEIFTITATIDEPQEVDFAIILEPIGGTATYGVDYSFDESILISAGETSATGEISILQSGDIEVDETLAVGFKTADVNADLSNFSFLATITNDHINDVLDLTMDWAGSYTYNLGGGAVDVTIDYCSADFDLKLYTAAGADAGYVLGSADCPEEGQLSGLADGNYFLVVDLYSNPFSGLNTAQPLPITLNISQEYFPDTETEIIFNGYTTDSSSGLQAIATLEVVGGYNYTINPIP